MSPDSMKETVSSFRGRSFSTLDFAREYQRLFPQDWQQTVSKYGEGGKGAGAYYSSYSFLAQQLDKLCRIGDLQKLDYREAPAEWGSPVIRYWANCGTPVDNGYYPDEIPDSSEITEGAKKAVWVNVYERDPKARLACIEIYGLSCFICNFNFEDFYGPLGTGYIHVHHLTPLSEVSGEYVVNPKEHLRPLCPNCHAMIHRSNPPKDVLELKSELKRAGKI